MSLPKLYLCFVNTDFESVSSASYDYLRRGDGPLY